MNENKWIHVNCIILLFLFIVVIFLLRNKSLSRNITKKTFEQTSHSDNGDNNYYYHYHGRYHERSSRSLKPKIQVMPKTKTKSSPKPGGKGSKSSSSSLSSSSSSKEFKPPKDKKFMIPKSPIISKQASQVSKVKPYPYLPNPTGNINSKKDTSSRPDPSEFIFDYDYHRNHSSHENHCKRQSVFSPHKIPVYFINLDNSTKRRALYYKQLSRYGFQYGMRIQARLPSASDVKTYILIEPDRQHEPKELACLVSHLIAIYNAVYDTNQVSEPYALVTEDDILFEMDVNYTALALSAPKNFGILQLMSSNAHEVKTNYLLFEKSTANQSISHSKEVGEVTLETKEDQSKGPVGWTTWGLDRYLWSTQAYLIQKSKVKRCADRFVEYNQTSKSYIIRIQNPSPSLFPCDQKLVKQGFKCFFPYRIVADYYLYLGCGPTYFSQVPIFNGAKVESTIHSKSSRTHAKEFDLIGRVLHRAKNQSHRLPWYIKPFQCVPTGTGTKMMIIGNHSVNSIRNVSDTMMKTI